MIGPTQRRILSEIREHGLFRARTRQECSSALKLHDRGILDRLSDNYTYTLRPTVSGSNLGDRHDASQ